MKTTVNFNSDQLLVNLEEITAKCGGRKTKEEIKQILNWRTPNSLLRRFDQGLIKDEDVFFVELRSRLGIKADPKNLDQQITTLKNAFSSRVFSINKETERDLLYWSKQEYYLWLISNINSCQWREIRGSIKIMDIKDVSEKGIFHGATLSFREELLKPDTRIFERALSGLNEYTARKKASAVQWEECVFADDVLEHCRAFASLGGLAVWHQSWPETRLRFRELGVTLPDS